MTRTPVDHDSDTSLKTYFESDNRHKRESLALEEIGHHNGHNFQLHADTESIIRTQNRHVGPEPTYDEKMKVPPGI